MGRVRAEYRSSIRSRLLITNALLKLIKVKDFGEITITDIVKEADINRGTFYAHFKDTSDVLRFMESESVENIASILTGEGDVFFNTALYLKGEESLLRKLISLDEGVIFNSLLRQALRKKGMNSFLSDGIAGAITDSLYPDGDIKAACASIKEYCQQLL